VNKLALAAAFIFLGTVAQAQIPTAGNIFIGYSYSGGDAFIHAPGLGRASDNASLNGWEGSLEGKFLPWVGIVADLSEHFGSHDVVACPGPPIGPPCFNAHVDAKRFTVLFGPRVSVSVGKFTPFAHALVGAGHVTDTATGLSNSDTSLATAIGGGLDYKLIKGIAWRVQGDELHTRFFGGGQNNFRFSTGIVFRF
jgi:hypothetical protein